EYNASRRAMAVLQDGGYLRTEELGPARQVLDAAALTYVAAAAAAMANLARMLLLRRSRD
ncbi:MAG TPA: zinc metallopeptidase, partial [Bacillota bacterium]|nr:zinc metallopeptidase [Bacillota bacterium]